MLKKTKHRRSRRLKRRPRRPLGRAIGFALQALALAWAAWVAWEGGFINKSRPTAPLQVNMGVANAFASRQDVDSLYSEARKRGEGRDADGLAALRDFRQLLHDLSGDMVILHNLAGRSPEMLPPEYRVGLRDFFTQEFPNFPQKCQINVAEVVPIGIVYRPGESYNILCATELSPEKIFKEYLKALNDRSWAVMEPIFDPATHSGMLKSFDGEWSLVVIVEPTRPEWRPHLAPPVNSDRMSYPVLIIWKLGRIHPGE